MGKARRVRKVSAKMMSKRDSRTRDNQAKKAIRKATQDKNVEYKPEESSAMFLEHNVALGPPYKILVDTSFINMAISNKMDMMDGFMDCLLAKATPFISDCIVAELEKHSRKFPLALRIAKDPRCRRLHCTHKTGKGYGDDCLVNRVTQDRVYIVATADRELRQRLRKIPGVPIMYIRNKRFVIERLPGHLA